VNDRLAVMAALLSTGCWQQHAQQHAPSPRATRSSSGSWLAVAPSPLPAAAHTALLLCLLHAGLGLAAGTLAAQLGCCCARRTRCCVACIADSFRQPSCRCVGVAAGCVLPVLQPLALSMGSQAVGTPIAEWAGQ
jgi:hypothetical protein